MWDIRLRSVHGGQVLTRSIGSGVHLLLHIQTLKFACIEQFSQSHTPSHKFLQAVLTEAMKCNM